MRLGPPRCQKPSHVGRPIIDPTSNRTASLGDFAKGFLANSAWFSDTD